MERSNFIAYEQGALSLAKIMYFFAEIIKTGQCWQLQGHYARAATGLINAGLINEQGEINNPAMAEYLDHNE